MSPRSWERLTYFAIIFTVATLAGVFLVGCGQKAPQIPQPAAIVVTTDADLRFALKRAHDVLDLTVDNIIAAKRFEEKLLASPDAAFVQTVHAGFVKGADDVLSQIRQLSIEIDTKALSNWAAVQARIKPIIDQLNALLSITTTKGFSWQDALGVAVNVLGPLLVPGVPHITIGLEQ
jgi:hypothetical protein